jgi:Tfp pilus assembly protein PilF
MGSTNTRAAVLLVSLLLVACSAFIYSPATGYGFLHFDDGDYVSDNFRVRSGITREGTLWAFTTTHAANWHPLTWLSLMADVELFGVSPGRHHLVNVVLHAANGILLFLVLFRMTGALWKSGAVAALFAVHPLHVESVAWISERKDVLSTFFWILTMWAYAAYARKPGIARNAVTVIVFSLGLLSKPMLVTLPFVLLLLDHWPLGRLSVPLSRRIAEKIPLFLLSAASSWITYAAQKRGGAVSTSEMVPLAVRVSNAFVSFVIYLQKTVWPAGLSILYPHMKTVPPPWKLGGAILFFAAASAFGIAQLRRRPWFATGWFWYAGTLVPVIGLIQVGSQAMADRYTYVPLIGIFLAAVWGLSGWLEDTRRGRTALGTIGVVSILALSAAARHQVGYWRSGADLFRHSIEVTGGTGNMHIQLAWELLEEGQTAEAERILRNTLGANPSYAPAHSALGVALDRQDRGREGLRHHEEAVRLDPEDVEARYRLGVALLQQGDAAQGATHLEEVTRRDPDYYQAFNNLGVALWETGRKEEAVSRYREALSINPEYARAHNNLGAALLTQGRREEAVFHFREALRIQPEYEQARKNLERSKGPGEP